MHFGGVTFYSSYKGKCKDYKSRFLFCFSLWDAFILLFIVFFGSFLFNVFFYQKEDHRFLFKEYNFINHKKKVLLFGKPKLRENQ